MRESTNYQEDYPAHPIEVVNYSEPLRHRTSPGKFDGTTTYHKEYIPHDIQVNNELHTQPVARAEPGNFYGETNYIASYPEHEILPPKKEKPSSYKKNSAPFEGRTVYANDFTEHDIVPD
jgi:hypothetical protein